MLSRKKKIVHFIRHAESEHNVPPYDNRRMDPSLTPIGQAQAEALGRQFPHMEDVDLVVCSPMKRAISTALIAFGEHLRASKKDLIALPELQELSGMPCDIGSSLAEILTTYREDPIDLHNVPWDWDSKDRQWSPTEQRTLARMNRFRAWLRDRPENNIVVIGHAHCLQLLVRDAPEDFNNDGIEEIRLGLLPVWRNCEWRSFAVEEDYSKVLLFEEVKFSRKAKSKGENVPKLDTDESRKRSDSSSLSNDKVSKRSSRSMWSARSSRESSLAPSSPAPSIGKTGGSSSKRTSLKESYKLLSALTSQR